MITDEIIGLALVCTAVGAMLGAGFGYYGATKEAQQKDGREWAAGYMAARDALPGQAIMAPTAAIPHIQRKAPHDHQDD